MTGSLLHRSAHHRRLVGYGDFLRKHAIPVADSQSVSGRVQMEAVVAATAAAAEEAQAPGLIPQEALGAVPATHGANPSLGMGLQNMATLLAVEPKPETIQQMQTLDQETMGRLAAGYAQGNNNNTNKQHRCRCGICIECTKPSRPRPLVCHHVACKSLKKCTIFSGYKPARPVNPDSRQTAKVSWLPTNFWSNPDHATKAQTRSEQVSQIMASFKLDEDRELINTITTSIQSGMRALHRQQVRRFHKKSADRAFDNAEALFKAGLLSKQSPHYDAAASACADESASTSGFSSASSSASSPSSVPPRAAYTAPVYDQNLEILRFQTLVASMDKVTKMISDGEIAAEEQPNAFLEVYQQDLDNLEEQIREKKEAEERAKARAKAKADAWNQSRKDKLQMAMTREMNSVQSAAYGRVPKVRSGLSGEVWNASPPRPTPSRASVSADVDRHDGTADNIKFQPATVESDGETDSSDEQTQLELTGETGHDHDQNAETAGEENDDRNDDENDDDDEEEVILFKGRGRR